MSKSEFTAAPGEPTFRSRSNWRMPAMGGRDLPSDLIRLVTVATEQVGALALKGPTQPARPTCRSGQLTGSPCHRRRPAHCLSATAAPSRPVPLNNGNAAVFGSGDAPMIGRLSAFT